MAGKLVLSTLNDDTGVLNVQNGMTGICKAWINYNGSTGTINGSFNVGSVTKNGTADYTINFTTAMPNSNYSIVGASRIDSSFQSVISPTTYSTTSIRIKTSAIVNAGSFFYAEMSNGLNNYDSTFVNVAIFSS